MVKFSAVIVARQINDYIRGAMPYFERQTFKDFEIIIVSESKEKEKFPKTRIICSRRASPAQARNLGAKNSRGEIIAFIDDDAYPEKDWFEKAAKNFEDKNIVAIGGPGLVPRNATFFQKVSSKVYELSAGKTGIRYGKGKRKEIDDWPTCNFFVRKKDFEKVGGFDSKYWGGEDTQICYSLLKTGKKIIYDPDMIIYHHPRKKLMQHLRQTYFWGMWRGFFMKKYSKSRQVVFFVPSLFGLWLICGAILSIISSSFYEVYKFSLMLYMIYLIILGIKAKSMKMFFPIIFLTFLTHLSYGAGFLKGIISKGEPIKKTLNPGSK